MTPHRPEVKIAATAFARMCAELDRVCPREAVLVPAIALTMRNPDRNPCAMIKLQDLAEILVARVVLVPPDRQINRAAAVCVRAATDEIVGLEVQDLLDRYPRLRACGYIHSHPFAQGSTWPSSGPGGDIEGHMLPLLARNRACNLDLSLSLIACRDPVAPGWKLQAFALASEVGPVLDLGFAAREQGAGERAALARSLMPPHESRPDAARVLRRLRTGLRDRGATYEEDALFDGWIRIVTTHPRQARAVLLIPPDFPRSGARVYLGGSAAGSTRAAPLEPRGATDPEALLRVLAPAPPPPGKGASPAAQDYFSRVQPVIGLGLSDKTVRIENLSACARVVELLAGCGVARFVAPATARPATWPLDRDRWAFPAADNGGGGGGTEREAIQSHLAWKNGFLPVACLPGGLADAGVAGELLSPGASAYVDWDGSRRRVTFGVPHGDLLGWENASYHVARTVRDMLLGRASWPHERCFLGHPDWPWATTASGPMPSTLPPAIPAARRVMVVGCGSVGSEVVRLLAGRISHWTLVDNGCVSVFNPHRQWFGTAEIGTRKVLALRRRLAPAEVLAIDRACDAERLDDFRSVLRRARPHLVVLSAGTSEQGPLARVLWRMGVPHVVAWAYPQARYFEVNVVLPQHGTPCLHCLRSHLAAGPAAPPPVRDELASFLYQELSGADREQAYRDLVAEPATPVDTARLAAVTTACVVEALRPPLDRAPWFRRLLREKTTCLLGGNQVTEIGGRPAYGIQRPGQVIRLGLEDLVRGTGACPGCGRCLPVAAGERAAEANEPNLSSRAADEGLLLASGA